MAETEKKMEQSARTRMLKSMPENVVQKGATWVSEQLDKLGITEKEKYEGKTPEEVATKKRTGGSVKRYESGGSTSAEAPKFDGFPKSEKAVEEFKETMQRLREKGKEVGEAVRSTRGAGSARGALGSAGPKNLGGKPPEMKKGGSVDGCAIRGKTRAKLKGR